MLERFTASARTIVIRSRDEATALGHSFVGTEHLLLALAAGQDTPGAILRTRGLTPDALRTGLQRLAAGPSRLLTDDEAAALASIGIDVGEVVGRIEATFGPGALEAAARRPRRGLFGRRPHDLDSVPDTAALLGTPRFTRRAKKVLELAVREARHRRDTHIGSEHLLLGILRDTGGPARALIAQAGVTTDTLRTGPGQRPAEGGLTDVGPRPPGPRAAWRHLRPVPTQARAYPPRPPNPGPDAAGVVVTATGPVSAADNRRSVSNR